MLVGNFTRRGDEKMKRDRKKLYQCPHCGKLHYPGSKISKDHSRKTTKRFKKMSEMGSGYNPY